MSDLSNILRPGAPTYCPMTREEFEMGDEDDTQISEIILNPDDAEWHTIPTEAPRSMDDRTRRIVALHNQIKEFADGFAKYAEGWTEMHAIVAEIAEEALDELRLDWQEGR
jgi:uncharacterized protein YbaR (Trm112 family)